MKYKTTNEQGNLSAFVIHDNQSGSWIDDNTVTIHSYYGSLNFMRLMFMSIDIPIYFAYCVVA